VLDWKTRNPKKAAIEFGVTVCQQYLLLIEEISFQCEKPGLNVSKKE
jgi:hypothetical protein